jgi:hypothetical protein
VTMTTLTLSERVERWLTRVNDHATLLDDASACKHSAASRLGRAREALEETTAELYVEGAIVGTNKEQRDACLHRLTAAERYEIREAEDAYLVACASLEGAERLLKRDREERTALELLVAIDVGLSPDRLTALVGRIG